MSEAQRLRQPLTVGDFLQSTGRQMVGHFLTFGIRQAFSLGKTLNQRVIVQRRSFIGEERIFHEVFDTFS